MRLRIGVLHRASATLLATAIFSLLACALPGGQAPGLHYYVLSYDLPGARTEHPFKGSIKVWRIQVYKPFNTNKIIYRTSPYQFEPTLYHVWAAKPGEMLTALLTRDLTNAGDFERVYGPYDSQKSDYGLALILDEFDCRTYGERPRAVIRMHATLTWRQQNHTEPNVIMKKIYEASVVCSNTRPQSVASAMSRGMKRISLELIHDIHNAILK